MNNNDVSELLRLKTPYFPALGELFVSVSAGDYYSGGIPAYFGEFFIFAAKGLGDPVGRRTYMHHHMSAGGATEVFELTKARAAAELSNELVKCLALNDSALFDGGLSLHQANWDDVAVLFRAGVLSQKTLQDIEWKTKSSFVVSRVREVLQSAQIQFEEAQTR